MKAIIFDKDGTLFDFNATWGAWAARMIAAECDGDPDRIAVLSAALGYDTVNASFRPGSVVIAETVSVLADHILPHIPDKNKDALIQRMKTAATQVPQVEVAPLAPLLSRLRADGFLLGLATNDAEAPARAHLQRAGVEDLFHFIAGSDSGYGGKPEPGQLHGFCAAMGTAPAACVMVGDSLHDLHAGRAAGMVTVGVLTGPAPREELAPMADDVLASIAELPAWLSARQ